MALLAQLRPGELAALRWRDLDLGLGVIYVRNTRTRDIDGHLSIGDGAKTPSSVRSFDLPAVCVRLLREHRRQQAAYILATPPGWWHDNGLVFPNRRGDVVHSRTMGHRVRALCREADVPLVTEHGLRHSGATWQRTLGIAPEVVQRRLGHKSIAITLEVYSHPSADEQRQALEQLEQALDALLRQARHA